MANEEEASVEAAAAARRERLRALKAAQELLNAPEDNSDNGHADDQPSQQLTEEENPSPQDQDEEEEEGHVNVKFRNYLPHDKELQQGKLAPPVLSKFEDLQLPTPAVPEEKKEDPFLRIAPKKPNWDLSRDVQKKLAKLEKRTQKALIKLMEMEEAKRNAAEGMENEEG